MSLPDPSATDRDAPASPLPPPPATEVGVDAAAPILEYGWLRLGGEGVRGEEPTRLHNVLTVRAWIFQGSLRIYARGQLLRKDGTRSRVQRSIEVDYLYRGQPAWLEAIIADAARRLDWPDSGGSGATDV